MTTNPTLIDLDGNHSITALTETYCKIETETVRITNGIIRIPLPSTDTGATQGINILGKQRVVTIAGYILGTEANMAAFINQMETWVNMGFQSTNVYTPSVPGLTVNASFDVLCDAFDWNRNATEPNKLNFTMSLGEGGLF